MHTIAVISQKGGSGKTTTLINLAVAAQQDGKAVLIVDLDLQASATDWHKERIKYFQAQAEKQGRNAEDADPSPHVQPTHPAGLPALLKAAEAQGVDFIFIDTAAKTESDTADAIEAADLVLITCRPSVMDLRAMRNSIRLCRVHEVVPHVVLTQIEPQGTLHEEARRSLELLGVDVLKAGLGRRAAFHHSVIDGRTAPEYEPQGKAAQEVSHLYKMVCHLVYLPSSQQASNQDAAI
jgi:chromosome partitioning protein